MYCVWNSWTSFFWLVVLYMCVCTSRGTLPHLTTPSVLANLIVDNNTGNIFIGGTNFLLKTTADLTVIAKNSTGPVPDNNDCFPVPSLCSKKRIPTNNRNKILLIDNSHQNLVTCGSVYHGVCQLRDMNTLSVKLASTKLVASSHPNPAVGFIAPGHITNEKVFYLGTTWDDKFGGWFSDVAAVSSLSLNPFDPFGFSNPGAAKQTRLEFQNYKFQVRYIYGFSSGVFSYFVTVQQTWQSFEKETPKIYETKIAHVCHKDGSYSTYTEIPLKCMSASGTNFNVATSAFAAKPGSDLASRLGISTQSDVLFVTFTKTVEGSSAPTMQSALCYFSIKDVNKGFESNIKNCSYGTIPLGMPWAKHGTGACQKEPYSLCKISTSNYPIGGTISVMEKAVLEWQNKPSLMSVVALSHEVHTAVFLGTGDGHLLKIAVANDSGPVTPYYDKQLVPGKSLKKLVLSRDKLSIYAATDNKVIKVPVEECASFSSCPSCSSRGDPFCGWCTLYNKCSRRLSCQAASLNPLRFTTNVLRCTRIVSTIPERFPHGSRSMLKAIIENLPPLPPSGDTYRCYINNKSQTTTYIGINSVKCYTPAAQDLPLITSTTGDVLVDLSLYATETGKKFITKKIPFYDCTRMKGCMVCSESMYDCDWCTYSGRCSAKGREICPGEVILSKNKKRPPGAAGCPKLVANQTFYIPNGVTSVIKVKAEDLPVIKNNNYGFDCVVAVDGKEWKVKATRDSDSHLTCSGEKYSYNAATPMAVAQLTVLWRGTDVVYKPSSVTLLLYKCEVSRTDCSTCLVTDTKFNCGWCKGSSKCTVLKACSKRSSWVPRSAPCLTKPFIQRFWPVAGPLTGGTELEIHGTDFGKSFTDIKDFVFVDKLPCIPDPDKYRVSRSIVCNTTRSTRELKGQVLVEVNNIKGFSKALFSYQTPEIHDFYPKKGPQSGGTPVNITGVKLNTGRNIMAWVGGASCVVDRASSRCLSGFGYSSFTVNPDSIEVQLHPRICGCSRVTDTSIPCISQASTKRTRRSSVVASDAVRVAFDGFTPASPPGEFQFTADPVIFTITPRKTFASGGLKLTVTGQYFDSIQMPKIFLTVAGVENATSASELCQLISSTSMICPSPNVSGFDVTPGSRNGSEVIAGFIMDRVPGLHNVTTLAITADPYFEPFPGGVKELKTESLIIEGNNLDILSKKDVQVTVEGHQCNVTGLDEKQLVCTVPKKESLPEESDGLFTVLVSAGYLTFNLGQLKFFEEPPPPKSYMLYIYIGVAAGGFILLLVIICLVCAYRRKKRQQKKNIKAMEVKMDNLESKVAKECREAFAELQTDMTDQMSDLSTSGMPFLDFRTYALHVLFPGVDDHQVLHLKEGNLSPNWEKGLRKFSQLIYNKEFLLIFVRTLESQGTFNMKDRCNLASLLMVALQGRMEYATDILWQLLCELIRKSVAKSHPKLLLRRTESVAEKLLTNWLAFCMYNHLKAKAGETLFVVFKAIKGQVEKGPVDAITGDARYSLSEDKLLRQTIEYESLRVCVTYDDNPPTNVNLLDCDTVSQAKAKILDTFYKNIPYSSRVEADSLQLELLQSNGTVKALRDDDTSSVIEGPWRRLNTLAHYKIPDGASLKLSTHQTFFYSSNDSGLHHRSTPRVGFSPFSYTPISRGSREDLEDGGRTYHLIKQIDFPTDRDDADHTKMLSEIYLTRLLATKGTLQKFVDGLFNSVFPVSHNGSSAPLAIKLLFDLLDSQFRELNLSDPEIIHTWKNNSIPLRFWINIVKNPNFIFDINKPGIVDSCLSVIAQLFMDACSISDHRLGKDSPSNKLLYAKEIPAYKQRVEKFYSDIRAQPTTSPEETSNFFTDLSMQYGHEFNSDNALKELFAFVTRYQDQLQEKLEDSDHSALASKLEHVVADITDEHED